MKKTLLPLLLMASVSPLFSQSGTWEGVYDLLQVQCAYCHNASAPGGLDLSGSMSTVYTTLYNTDPSNATATASLNKLVYPGDPYRSFLYRKINNGLALDVSLQPGEGLPCPQGAPAMDNKDIELIRQWILFGAMDTGTQADIALIDDFYDNEGIQSVPSPPTPPPPGEGYQIHLGPYFLWPSTEAEYFNKYYTLMPDDKEINRIDTYMGPYSHHFITYKFNNPAGPLITPYGLHVAPDYWFVDLVSATQYQDSLKLPTGTAFSWESGTVLDLDSHYINYSDTKSLACEVYLNIYTQPSGTAKQIIKPVLLNNPSIYIPNDDQPHVFDAEAHDATAGSDDQIFIWAMSSHTHKYGDDFDIFLRNPDGTKGEQVFDASCQSTQGAPGCITEIYDYRHPPVRYWPGMLAVKPKNGIIYETTYINDGPVPVAFGLTSDDEMMVMFYFYVDDTTGLNLPQESTDISGENLLEGTTVFPNPAGARFYVQVNGLDAGNLQIRLMDLEGRITLIHSYSVISTTPSVIQIDRGSLPSGMYLVEISDGKQPGITRKLILE